MRYLTFFVSLVFLATVAKGQVKQTISLYYHKEPVRIIHPGNVFSTVDWKPEMKAELVEMLGEETAGEVIRGSNESAWPSDIASLGVRVSNYTKMLDYKCQYLTRVNKNMVVLLVSASENTHMEKGMKPKVDFYLVMQDNAIKTSYSETTDQVQEFFDNLVIIINDFEEGFVNLMGEELDYISESNESIFDCNVPLEGAYDLTFHEIDAGGNISLRAKFLGDIDPQSAQVMFRDLAYKVSVTELSCCTLIKKPETARGNSRSQDFEVTVKTGRNPVYQKMVINVSLEAYEAFNTEGQTVTEWEPVIYIYKK